MNQTIKQYIVSYIKILLGAMFYALGFGLFCYPNDITTGGVTGIAMIINYLTDLPVGVLTIVINVPLFFFSWRKFGLKFIIASLAGTLLASVFVDLVALLPVEITHDALLGSVYGGFVKGFGLGLVYSAGATTGGVDLIAKFLRRKYQHINFMFIASKTIDFVLFGAVNSKVCYIITDESVPIKDAIVTKLHRGVTFLHGEGAWSHKEKDIILCVIRQSQIVDLKHIVRAIDEHAFVIVSDSREIFGKGFISISDEN